jgi:hypothetical protein
VPHCARAIATVASLLAVAIPAAANAHWSASAGRSLLVERYLVCDEDVDARCVGPDVAHDQLIDALRLGPIEPDRNNDRVVDPAHEATIFAAYFDMRDAIPHLRRMLALPMPEGAADTHAEMEVNGLRAEAAFALAALGDETSAPAIAKLVRAFETEGHGFLWRDTLGALTRLSSTHASAYARDFLDRHALADMRMSLPGGSSHLEALAPIVVARDRGALPILRELTARESATDRGSPRIALVDAHHWCQLMATRLELGDQPLRDDVRIAFAGSYGGTMVATCDADFLRTYGTDAEDAGILLRHLGRDDLGFDAGIANVAYDRVIALVAALAERQQREGPSKTITKARKLLRDGLRERSTYPHVADPTHRNFAPHFVAMHTAALAGLGDTAARAKLHAMIVDDADRSGVADLAAVQALRLDLPNAVDDASQRLALDVAFTNDERSGIFAGLRAKLLDGLRADAPDDPRWTVALVDAEIDVREHAIHLLSRRSPHGTCDAVLTAVNHATDRAIDDALLVLTTLPGRCRAPLRRAATDAHRAANVRGMAFEALAILGEPTKPPRTASRPLEIHLERAATIRSTLAGATHPPEDRVATKRRHRRRAHRPEPRG